MNKAKVTDKNIHSGIIGVYFNAVNFEETDLD